MNSLFLLIAFITLFIAIGIGLVLYDELQRAQHMEHLWDMHCRYEFAEPNVDLTLPTMVLKRLFLKMN